MVDKITKHCDECQGEGYVSACCSMEVDGKKCLGCGKFCKKEVCHYCGGQGYFEYKAGDEIEVFICIYSPEYLKDALYKPKKLGDTKTFNGKIIALTDNWTAVVKIKRKKEEFKIKIDDLTQL